VREVPGKGEAVRVGRRVGRVAEAEVEVEVETEAEVEV